MSFAARFGSFAAEHQQIKAGGIDLQMSPNAFIRDGFSKPVLVSYFAIAETPFFWRPSCVCNASTLWGCRIMANSSPRIILIQVKNSSHLARF